MISECLSSNLTLQDIYLAKYSPRDKLRTSIEQRILVNTMNLTNKKDSKIRPPSGLLVSFGRIITVLGAIFIVGIAIYSGSLFFMGFVAVFFVIPAAKRFIRGEAKLPLSEQGEGTSDDYSIINGVVEVRKGGVFWSELLSDYEGVLQRDETRHSSGHSRRNSRSTTRHIVELRHRTDRTFDVNIYTSLEKVGVRARWEETAQKYNLPALRDLGDGEFLRREPGDIGKSLQELASENILDVSFAIDAPVPPGANWTRDGSVLKVNQRRAPLRCFLLIIPLLLFYMLVGYNLPFSVIFGNNDPAMLPIYRAIVYLPAVFLATLWIVISYQIRVTPSEVIVTGRLGPIPLWRQALPLDEVEEVLVDPSLVVWHTVLIESISVTLRVWPLNETSAQWLAQFLRSAIANAPKSNGDGSGTSAKDPRD